MDGEPVTLATVPAIGKRLYVSWGLGNELHIVDLADGITDKSSTASVVQWHEPSAVQRRIAYDSLGKYQELQQGGQAALSPSGWSATLDYSRAVSAILAADGVRGEEATGAELAALREQALWDLLTLFFLEGTGGGEGQGLVSQDLARWLRSHAVAVSGGVGASPLPESLAELLHAAVLPEGDPEYWPTVSRLVALGWIDAAIDLLGLHSAWLRYDGSAQPAATDTAAQALVGGLEAATLLLRRFPLLAAAAAGGAAAAAAAAAAPGAGRECASASEFAAYRRTWQAQCAALAANEGMWRACEGADIATANGLRQVLGVLAGEEPALAAAAASWLELLVAQLLHVYPTARPRAELRQLSQRCFEAGGGAAAPDFLQAVAALLHACCESDVQDAMRVCSAHCSPWFMAHAPHIMAAHPAGAGVLGRELAFHGGDQVEFYTLEAAAALMPHPTTWPLAAAYLAWCPVHGQAALRAMLRRLPLQAGDPWIARKAIEIASQHGLPRLVEDLQRTQGVLCWQAGMLGAALHWLAACGDVQRLDIVLQPLADAVSAGRVSAEQAAALQALQPMLRSLPPGSSNCTLLDVHRLLTQGSSGGGGADGGGGMHAAVAALVQLPEGMRDSCLQLVCGVLPTVPPGELSEQDVLFLLQWLLCAEGRLPPGKRGAALAAAIMTARLTLVRSLAGSHMRQQAAATRV